MKFCVYKVGGEMGVQSRLGQELPMVLHLLLVAFLAKRGSFKCGGNFFHFSEI